MKVLSLVLAFAAIRLVQALIITTKNIDQTTCGQVSTAGSRANLLRFVINAEAELLILAAGASLQPDFLTLTTTQLQLQQQLLGRDGNSASFVSQRAAGLGFLQSTLRDARDAAANTNPSRKLLIQCGERSTVGIGLATNSQSPQTPFVHNFFDNINMPVKPGSTTPLNRCTGTVTAYVLAHVIVLCDDYWDPVDTRGEPRRIWSQTLDQVLSNPALFDVDDHIEDLLRVRSTTIVHELMHWGTYQTGVSSTIRDPIGYKWDEITTASAVIDTQTTLNAQTYVYLALVDEALSRGWVFNTTGFVKTRGN
ncbi:hypothetical protein F5884DRAFT_860760 [Xylogone sp. PMI_703]|nr:hypothetical protein F5884DRAFT_860760 [Xylogone sp. PMI_703]